MNTHSRIATLVAWTVSLVMFLGMAGAVEAQMSYSGDTVCGSSSSDACTFDDAKSIINNVIMQFVLPLTLAFLTIFIMWRVIMAWYAYAQGNASAWKDARDKIGNAILGLIIITLVFGGFFTALLTMFGAQPWALQLLQILSEGFIPHAYAQSASVAELQNPLQQNSLYEVLLQFIRIALRWFIIPLLLTAWVWTGFSFVLAQGRPEAISKAKKLLGWAIAATILIVSTEGFLYALQATLVKIVPQQQTQSTQSTFNTGNGTPDGRTAPSVGQSGASCQEGGEYGRIGTDGKCYTPNGCAGKRGGDSCKVGGRSGTCGQSDEGVFSCYVTPVTLKVPGTSCQTVDGRYGQIGTDGATCYVSSGGAGR